MLTLYRRHFLKTKDKPKGCPHRDDRYWRRCNCPMWVEGTLNRVYKRESLKTRSWDEAKKIVAEWEAKPDRARIRHTSVDLADAAAQYVKHCAESNLSDITVKKRRQLLDRFITWCTSHDYETVGEIDIGVMREWFAVGQHRKPGTRVQERTELRLFFQFAVKEKKWIASDPTQGLPKIKVRQEPTQYVPREEFSKLLKVISDPKWHALTLLLRWSGLRITDALKLERKHIVNGLLMIHQGKTSTPVTIPLPPRAVNALEKLPKTGEPFFDGETEPQADAFRSVLKRAAKRAGLKHVHPHQLRDTFAVEMLLSGATLDQVSKALGHSSVTVTERHYAPWVKARQDLLNATIRKSWQEPGFDDVDWDGPGVELIETTPPRPLS
jgi:integrase/recombinase XerD